MTMFFCVLRHKHLQYKQFKTLTFIAIRVSRSKVTIDTMEGSMKRRNGKVASVRIGIAKAENLVKEDL